GRLPCEPCCGLLRSRHRRRTVWRGESSSGATLLHAPEARSPVPRGGLFAQRRPTCVWGLHSTFRGGRPQPPFPCIHTRELSPKGGGTASPGRPMKEPVSRRPLRSVNRQDCRNLRVLSWNMGGWTPRLGVVELRGEAWDTLAELQARPYLERWRKKRRADG